MIAILSQCDRIAKELIAKKGFADAKEEAKRMQEPVLMAPLPYDPDEHEWGTVD